MMSPRWTGERRNLQSASFGEYGRGRFDIAKVIGLVVNLRFLVKHRAVAGSQFWTALRYRGQTQGAAVDTFGGPG